MVLFTGCNSFCNNAAIALGLTVSELAAPRFSPLPAEMSVCNPVVGVGRVGVLVFPPVLPPIALDIFGNARQAGNGVDMAALIHFGCRPAELISGLLPLMRTPPENENENENENESGRVRARPYKGTEVSITGWIVHQLYKYNKLIHSNGLRA